MFLERD